MQQSGFSQHLNVGLGGTGDFQFSLTDQNRFLEHTMFNFHSRYVH